MPRYLFPNFRELDHVCPLLDVAVQQFGQRHGRASRRDGCQVGQALFHIGQRHSACAFLIELRQNVSGVHVATQRPTLIDTL